MLLAHRPVLPLSRFAVFGWSVPNGEPHSSPPGMGVPFHSLKENTMFAVPVTREMRAIGVLLGGSGLAWKLTVQTRPVAALLRPHPSGTTVPGHGDQRTVGDRSC